MGKISSMGQRYPRYLNIIFRGLRRTDADADVKDGGDDGGHLVNGRGRTKGGWDGNWDALNPASYYLSGGQM